MSTKASGGHFQGGGQEGGTRESGGAIPGICFSKKISIYSCWRSDHPQHLHLCFVDEADTNEMKKYPHLDRVILGSQEGIPLNL